MYEPEPGPEDDLAPGPEDDLAPAPRWTRRRAASRLDDTGLYVVVPTGRPGRVGRRLAELRTAARSKPTDPAARSTATDRAAHGRAGRLPRVDRYGWVLAASTLVLLAAAIVIIYTR